MLTVGKVLTLTLLKIVQSQHSTLLRHGVAAQNKLQTSFF